MGWKIFHKTVLQVEEVKLHKRKEQTYIHLSEENA